ncbi:MAG: hypothetical protein DRP87_15725 [Spirochaetes bacterium]|nr:MAG: hypothetical protein DRP87_15725 [Spirochaetota bacterium]
MKNNKFKAVIFDLDGVLEFKGNVYPGAVELLQSLRKRRIHLRILSNSTLKSRRTCTEKLLRRGFYVKEEEVITASFATAQYLKSLNPKSIWVMLKGDGLEEFSHFRHDSENPEYIILGDFREGFNFLNLNKALQLLYRGTKLIVMITEKIDNSMGELELTVGAYGKMLEDAAGIKATYIGKPNKYIFDIALSTLPEIDKHRILMVGDKISTDILGAKNADIRSALVKTGEFKQKDLDSPVNPDYIFDTVRDLNKLFFRP